MAWLAMATAVIVFLQIFAELGLGPALVQHSTLDQPILRRAFRHSLNDQYSTDHGLVVRGTNRRRVLWRTEREPGPPALSLQFIIGAFGVIPNVHLMRNDGVSQTLHC